MAEHKTRYNGLIEISDRDYNKIFDHWRDGDGSNFNRWRKSLNQNPCSQPTIGQAKNKRKATESLWQSLRDFIKAKTENPEIIAILKREEKAKRSKANS